MPMTAGQFRECRDLIGWSQVRLAEELCVTSLKVRQWAHGSVTVPEVVAIWMRAFSADVAAALHRNPPPAGKVPPKWVTDPKPRKPKKPKMVKEPAPRNQATLRRLHKAMTDLRERQAREVEPTI